MFCDLRGDDQVLAFRILPRKTAATVFECLPRERQRSLVKASAGNSLVTFAGNSLKNQVRSSGAIWSSSLATSSRPISPWGTASDGRR
jgi:hypothetical protein